uniref:uncharacterized protein LOC109974308 n=1 Tax=Monopterus albus TaxID=43700 RepID=UPI0009B39FA9|nr:uncharacterized protein LOC109974308 [Monopterus albus]
MEGTEQTIRERTTERDGTQEADHRVLLTSKPLHRFVQREPKSLGIVILIFGCIEILMGFQLARENERTSTFAYVPFWQGILFIICGTLSIYTEVHPSKKMVTVCLAMYVISLLGIIVSGSFRLFCFNHYSYLYHWASYQEHNIWAYYRAEQLFGVEGLLLASSLCVFVLLIFLCTVARLALKSTQNQVIIQRISSPPPQQSDTTSD